jgi:FKBP-type peptidyl-prolyl cis-trans isomerase FkpA
MKHFLCCLLFCVFLSHSFAEAIREEADKGNEKADLSYAFGMALGSDMKQAGLEFNYDAFTRGFRETMEGAETRFTMDEAVERVQTAFRAAMAEQAERNRQIEVEFLAENGIRPGIITTESGLQYEILAEGTGAQPEPTDFVKVHYRGAFIDGIIFDSSYDRNEPAEFPLEGVIPGWSEGIQLMKIGGKSRLYIPSKLAYGAQGAGSDIPPNATLIFEVELLEVYSPPDYSNFDGELGELYEESEYDY